MMVRCETLSEVNQTAVAGILGTSRLADQSSLSRTLNALTLKNIEKL